MIEVTAPGKLYIAGEYAVVEAGHPAMLVAVDRHIRVRVEAAPDMGRIISDQYGSLPLVWHRRGPDLVIEPDKAPFDYVISAISMAEQVAREIGHPLQFFDLTITSELDDASGRKFGLGSSAAVTVATLKALDQFYDLGLTREELFKLALLATLDLSPGASGGDVAASVYGGWLAYRGFDRGWLAAERVLHPVINLIQMEWPALSITRVTPPDGLKLYVGWTGTPASTSRLVGNVQAQKTSTQAHYAEFLAQSKDCVERLIAACEQENTAEIKQQIRRNRQLLKQLSGDTGIVIETTKLSALCDAADRHGAAAKISGAGGGDCGIALAGADDDVSGMLREWESHDIRRLSLRVQPPEGSLGYS